jgi:hypothetical protein
VKKPARDGDRLISGKLRNKRSRDAAAGDHVTVDGTSYAWSRRHGWLVHGKGLKAISLSVALDPGRTRELILDLALRVGVEEGPPSEERVLRVLEEGIRAALEAGWNPDSRGRAFRYDMGETT